jgi:hypothetical protein
VMTMRVRYHPLSPLGVAKPVRVTVRCPSVRPSSHAARSA